MSACPPLVSMGLLVELLPQYNEVSVYRWRATTGKSRLPEPDLTVGHVALWEVDTIVAWARDTGKELDAKVLTRICQSQSVESDHEL